MTENHIGTSGWSYKGWKENFFPAHLKDRDLLAYYQEQFNTVEINTTHYRLPRPETVEKWAQQAPSGFLYACKVSRYISHRKKLRDPDEHVPRFMSVYRLLGAHAGPVLLQLPPGFTPAPERLDAAIAAFRRQDPDVQLAVEFRNRESYNDALFDVLNDHGASLVVHDMEGSGVSGPNGDAPFVFMRYHGTEGKKYAGNYDDERLRRDSRRIKNWLSEGRDVYAYFNNDAEGYAPWNALTLRRMVEEH